MRIRPYGASALLVELDAEAAVQDLARWVREQGVDAREVVPGAATVLLSGVADPAAVAARLAQWRPDVATVPGPVVELPVRYDGPDLADVARLWDMTVREAAATHAALEHTVAFCGFSPGFAYLRGLPAGLAVPRLATPRTRVPAGSLAVADRWTGIYPSASPGGWRLLGRTDAVLWDVAREPPALLPPGTRVRCVAVS